MAEGGQIKQRITDDQLKELAQVFGVEAAPKFLAYKNQINTITLPGDKVQGAVFVFKHDYI